NIWKNYKHNLHDDEDPISQSYTMDLCWNGVPMVSEDLSDTPSTKGKNNKSPPTDMYNSPTLKDSYGTPIPKYSYSEITTKTPHHMPPEKDTNVHSPPKGAYT
ncbi:hypothetical protein L9F63_005003, partial [Diploptera punctata]